MVYNVNSNPSEVVLEAKALAAAPAEIVFKLDSSESLLSFSFNPKPSATSSIIPPTKVLSSSRNVSVVADALPPETNVPSCNA